MASNIPSLKLIEWHRKYANDIPIESEAFTLRLLEEANRLKKEISESGG